MDRTHSTTTAEGRASARSANQNVIAADVFRSAREHTRTVRTRRSRGRHTPSAVISIDAAKIRMAIKVYEWIISANPLDAVEVSWLKRDLQILRDWQVGCGTFKLSQLREAEWALPCEYYCLPRLIFSPELKRLNGGAVVSYREIQTAVQGFC